MANEPLGGNGVAARPRLLVAIVNYRTADLVIECLDSLAPQIRALPGARVAIADNDSQDGSFAAINEAIGARGYRDWATVVALPTNGGFAAGNNALIRPALQSETRPDFVLLLNPDTLVLDGALETMLDFLADKPKIGILGAHQQLPNGTPLRSAFRFVSPLGELDAGLRFGPASRVLSKWQHAPEVSTRAVAADWVSGGCMMIRREVLENVGLMDDHYFLYFEELDFCLHAKRAGFETWFLPEARIVHIGGRSTGVNGQGAVANRRPGYWFDSRRRYYLKNYGPTRALSADICYLVATSIWRARRVIQNKPEEDPPHFLSDLWRNSVFVRGFEL
jgi:N-acetylglucosaminyl-diphospho-decaprenol L-rhamnosyltransferase